MMSLVLFHSVMGLRQVERDAADLIRTAGFEVVTPDLYEGRTACTIADGMALMGSIGWTGLCDRAGKAVADLPDKTALAGLSMGAGIIGYLWPKRRLTSGVLLIHGLADIPNDARAGLPLQVHLAEPDHFVHDAQMADWQAAAKQVSLAAELFTYPGCGHFFTDPASTDYDAKAAGETWDRALTFLKNL